MRRRAGQVRVVSSCNACLVRLVLHIAYRLEVLRGRGDPVYVSPMPEIGGRKAGTAPVMILHTNVLLYRPSSFYRVLDQFGREHETFDAIVDAWRHIAFSVGERDNRSPSVTRLGGGAYISRLAIRRRRLLPFHDTVCTVRFGGVALKMEICVLERRRDAPPEP